MVEKKDKCLPEKDDQFTITSQIQNKDGWVKLHWMIFNDPELNLRAEYSLFDR